MKAKASTADDTVADTISVSSANGARAVAEVNELK